MICQRRIAGSMECIVRLYSLPIDTFLNVENCNKSSSSNMQAIRKRISNVIATTEAIEAIVVHQYRLYTHIVCYIAPIETVTVIISDKLLILQCITFNYLTNFIYFV